MRGVTAPCRSRGRARCRGPDPHRRSMGSASSSACAVPRRTLMGGRAYTVGSCRPTCKVQCSANRRSCRSRADSGSSALVGWHSSATTRPRSVTSTTSPATTSRTNRLRCAFSSRRPTALMPDCSHMELQVHAVASGSPVLRQDSIVPKVRTLVSSSPHRPQGIERGKGVGHRSRLALSLVSESLHAHLPRK